MIGWIIGGAVAALVAAAASGDDDDDSDYNDEVRKANLQAANRRRHLEAERRKRAKAAREARRRQEARDDFSRLTDSKFREFRLKSRLNVALRMSPPDCGFRSFVADTKGVSTQVKEATAEHLLTARKERDDCARRLKELKSVISILEQKVA